jgi:cationic peptide transport system substrate-binding protein
MQIYLKLTWAIVSAFLLAGCDQHLIDHNKIRETGFVYCGQGNPSTFNPQLVDSGITVDALAPQIFDNLLTINSISHTPQPNLAKSWTVSKDGLTYRFHLERGVSFQTTPWFKPTRTLDATDVIFSFNRILDPMHPYHNVGNSNYPWFTGNGYMQLVKQIKAIDPYTVEFTLTRPDNSFLSLLATPYAAVLSSEYGQMLIEKDEKSMIDSHPIGTGPFYLNEFQVSDFVRLKRHEHYWKGLPKMEQVVFDIAQRGTGTLAKLLLNECDVLSSPISSQIPIIERRDNITLRTTPAMNVSYIAINTQHPAINDPRVRRALSFAIDRQKIIDSVYYGRGVVAYNLLPPMSWAYYKNTSQVRYDRQYALGLLREAGYGNGLELTMSVPVEPSSYDPSPRKTAELIQSHLSDIGVKLTLISQDKRHDHTNANHRPVDLYLTGKSGKTDDPDRFLRPVLSCQARSQGVNLTQWCNDNVDMLLNLSLETERPRFRLNLYKQIQNIINQDMPVIPIAHGMQFKAYNNTLTGFSISPFHVQPFNDVERLN